MFEIYAVYRTHIAQHSYKDDFDPVIAAISRKEEYSSVNVDNRSIGCYFWHWIVESTDKAQLEAFVKEIQETAAEMGVVLSPDPM